MDIAQAINKAQDAVTKADLPADLQQAAFTEVLRHLLATADATAVSGSSAGSSGSAGSAGTAPPAGTGQGWSQVTNTDSPIVPPPTG
jgi:hypothetical protein